MPAAALAQSAPGRLPSAAGRRALRVSMLVVAIVLMSLGDLAMTLDQLKTIGMGEGNPIARYVIGFNSPALLAVWKCASIALACIIFIWLRTRPATEVACWVCTCVLGVLSVMWLQYAAELPTMTCSLHTITHSDNAVWVRLESN